MNTARLLAGAITPDVSGTIIAGHRLLDEIGRGGMGVVFSACHVATGRIVALKTPHPGADAAVVQRFHAEASAAAALDHPGILPIHEIGECGGVPFFTMRFAECGSLAEGAGAFTGDPRAAAEMVARVADALAHAHERGLLHRDVKPSNILLVPDENVAHASRLDADGEYRRDARVTIPLLGDFGLARWLGRDSALTVAGSVLGTPSYLAPELLGPMAEATTASDIFSLGAVLYHLFCGRPPFAGDTVAATLTLVAECAPPAPRTLNAALPRDLEAVVLRSLAPDAAHRYTSAREFARDLRRWLGGEPVHARAASPAEVAWRWCRRRPALAATLAALASVSVLAFALSDRARRDESAAKLRAEASSAQLRDANVHIEDSLDRSELGRAEYLFRSGDSADALAPLVRVIRRNPSHPVAVPRLASALWHGGFALPLPPPMVVGGKISRMQFLRDGRTLLVSAGNGITTWDAAAGRRLLEFERDENRASNTLLSPDERTLAAWNTTQGKFLHLFDTATGRRLVPPIRHEAFLPGVCFSPDGSRIFAATSDPVAQIRDARTWEPLGGALVHGAGLWDGAFSPDGDTLATCAGRTVRLWGSRTQSLRLTLAEMPAEVRWLRFSPDGRWLLAVCHDGKARFFSAADGQPAGVTMRHDAEINTFAFSADGARLLTTSPDHTARVWAAPGGEPLTPPLRHRDNVNFAAFSGDGARIATSSNDQTVRVWDARTGRPLTQPLRHVAQPRTAVFTPDGATLYSAGSEGLVHRWDLRHPALPAPVAFVAATGTPGMRLSADGRRKVTFSDLTNTAVLTDAKTGAVIGSPLAHSDSVTDADFSPDGALVATASRADEARVWDAETGRAVSPPLRHTRTVATVAFSADSRFVATGSVDSTARVWDARSGAPAGSALKHDDYVADVHFSPDGRRIATASRDKTARVWDVASGQPLTEPLRHESPVERVRFDRGGQRIVTSTAGSAHTWEVPDFSTPPPAWLATLAEIVSFTELTSDPADARMLIARYEQTRAAALAHTGDDAYAQLARRLFSSRVAK